jgi:hypothetical protein
MGSRFRVAYKLNDGKEGPTAVFVGPKEATVENCESAARLAASNYGIDPETLVIEEIPHQTNQLLLCHGFIHPLQGELPDGRLATITGWYF